jgi:hypothetical protein
MATTESERQLYELCRKSFLSYWSFENPHRPDGSLSKELCDVLVVCDRHILAFSDKSIGFPNGDPAIGWARWHRKSVLGSARQLLGSYRYLQLPHPRVCADRSLRTRLRCSLPSPADRDIHLIAVANGATEACSAILGEPIATLMLSNERKEDRTFTVGDVGDDRAFVHVFTDLSLRMVLREFDTVSDLVRYLRNRARFFRSTSSGLVVRGEEELIPLYFRGYDEATQDYDISRGLKLDASKFDYVAVDGGFYEDMIQRPEYKARRKENALSYGWDALIEKFAGHRIMGTGGHITPRGLEHHEGGIRLMALEPRLSRRMLSQHVMHAAETFRGDQDVGIRTVIPGKAEDDQRAYIFLQLRPPASMAYEEYRRLRQGMLEVYALSLLHDQPQLQQVVAIAFEPLREFVGKLMSEDMILAERHLVAPEALAEAKQVKLKLGTGRASVSQLSRAREFPSGDS